MINLDHFNKINLNSCVYFISKKETLLGGLVQEKNYKQTSNGDEIEILVIFLNEGTKSIENARLSLNSNQVFITIEDAKDYLKKSLEQKINNLCNRVENGVKILIENLTPENYEEKST
jgi:hypothetical protein